MNFLRDKCATTGTGCKTVVILSMRHCFMGKNDELELRNYKGRAFPFLCLKFGRVQCSRTQRVRYVGMNLMTALLAVIIRM